MTPLFSSTEAKPLALENVYSVQLLFSGGLFISEKEEGSTRKQSGTPFGPPFAEYLTANLAAVQLTMVSDLRDFGLVHFREVCSASPSCKETLRLTRIHRTRHLHPSLQG